MPIEGISLTTVFSLMAVSMALSLSVYIGAYYLQPIFDADVVISSLAYDLSTIYDLAYTLPGEVTIRYFGPQACEWDYNTDGNSLSSFHCVDASTIILKSVQVDKQYLLVYDDPYVKYDSLNEDNDDNIIFKYMGKSLLSDAIGYPRISYLSVNIPYANMQVSAQVDDDTGNIYYGSLATAVFAGSYSDSAMASASTPYDIEIKDYSFVVSKNSVGTYYYTLSNYSSSPQELSSFLSYTAAKYTKICNNNLPVSESYLYPELLSSMTKDNIKNDENSFLNLEKGIRVRAYINKVSAELVEDAWNFDNGNYSSLDKTDLAVYGAENTDGIFGNAYKFDGINDYLESPLSNGFDNETFSISLWAKFDSISRQFLVSKLRNSPSNGFSIFLDSDGKLKFLTAANGISYTIESNENIVAKKWYYITAVFNGTHIMLYVNSELQESMEAQIDFDTLKKFTIGKSSYSNEAYMKGMIDDVVFFNTALSQSQINLIYSSVPSNSICQERISITNDESELYSELYSYWNFDNHYDYINGNYIDTQNSAIISDGNMHLYSSQFGKGFANSSFKFGSEEFSISVMINSDQINSEQYIISTNNDACNSECEDAAGYTLKLNSGNKIVFQIASSYGSQDYITSSSAIPANAWTQITVTYKDGNLKVYINGELDSQKSTQVYYVPEPYYNLTLGVSAYNTVSYGNPNFFDGYIDELKFFTKELSASEAEYIYLNKGSLYTSDFYESMKINDYVQTYCFDINSFASSKPCSNVNAVVFSDEFVQTINVNNNFYAGWNSCIKPYLDYDASEKKLILGAIQADYNIIAGGCVLAE